MRPPDAVVAGVGVGTSPAGVTSSPETLAASGAPPSPEKPLVPEPVTTDDTSHSTYRPDRTEPMSATNPACASAGCSR